MPDVCKSYTMIAVLLTLCGGTETISVQQFIPRIRIAVMQPITMDTVMMGTPMPVNASEYYREFEYVGHIDDFVANYRECLGPQTVDNFGGGNVTVSQVDAIYRRHGGGKIPPSQRKSAALNPLVQLDQQLGRDMEQGDEAGA